MSVAAEGWSLGTVGGVAWGGDWGRGCLPTEMDHHGYQVVEHGQGQYTQPAGWWALFGMLGCVLPRGEGGREGGEREVVGRQPHCDPALREGVGPGGSQLGRGEPVSAGRWWRRGPVSEQGDQADTGAALSAVEVEQLLLLLLPP